MGADDANEGHAAGECVEHDWQLASVILDSDGAHQELHCARCPGVLLVGPSELTGQV